MPDLKEVHIIALEQILVKHTKAKTDADTFKERLPAVEEIVPKFITQSFTMKLLQLDQTISECQLAVANRKGKISALKDSLRASLNEFTEVNLSIIKYVADAGQHLKIGMT